MITVKRTQAPAGEFVQIFVDDMVAWTRLDFAGDNDAAVEAWRASGVLLEEEWDGENLPYDIDFDVWRDVGATRVVFAVSDDDEREIVIRVVNDRYVDRDDDDESEA